MFSPFPWSPVIRKCLWKKTHTEKKKITDGKPASIAAYLKSFSKCSLIRCTRHFEANCKYILIGMSIKGNMKDAMLDVVFGEHGLVEAENKQDLKEKWKMLLLCCQKWKDSAYHRTSS